MDENEPTSGLDVLEESIDSALEEEGPLASVIRESLPSSSVTTPTSAAPRQTQYRDELMRQLQSTTQKLLAPKPEPKNFLEALSRQFVMPTGKTGDLLIARQERAKKEEEEDLKRREAILTILDKQARLEREQEEDLARARAAEELAIARAEQARARAISGNRRKTTELEDLFELEKTMDPNDPNLKTVRNRINILTTRAQTPDRAPRPSQFDRLVQARLRQQQGTATPEDEIIIAITEGKKLTPQQQAKDREILQAREKTKNLTEEQLRSLKLKSRYDPNAEETLRLWDLAQRPTFQEMLDDINAETSSNVIDEEMP